MLQSFAKFENFRNVEGIRAAVCKGTTKIINADQPKTDVYAQGFYPYQNFLMILLNSRFPCLSTLLPSRIRESSPHAVGLRLTNK